MRNSNAGIYADRAARIHAIMLHRFWPPDPEKRNPALAGTSNRADFFNDINLESTPNRTTMPAKSMRVAL